MRKTLLLCTAFVAAVAAQADDIILPSTAKQQLTMTAEAGSEVSITLGTYANEDVYAVDFGDGVLKVDSVGNENGGIKGEDGKTKVGTKYTSATKFSGTVTGDGTIKVYGTSPLWYLNCSGGATPTSFSQEGLKDVVQISITGANVENIALPETDKLKQFNFNNSPLKSIDLSKATALTSLTINSTTVSKFEPQLESIDLSKNIELTYLSLQGNQNNYGKLTTLDLTNNTKIESIYTQYNALTNVKLPKDAALTFLNLQNNQLTSVDLSGIASSKDIYMSDNKLSTIDLSKLKEKATVNLYNNELTEIAIPVDIKTLNVKNNKLTSVSLKDVTTQLNLEGNCLTMATIPAQPASMNTASKTKKFTYAPQADMEVESILKVGGVLDLTSQLTVAKGELNPAAVDDQAAYKTWLENAKTTYSFVTASSTALVEGTDYEVVEPGKFKFLKTQGEAIHGEMTNTAFPKFTGASVFKTTEFTVSEIESGLFDFENNNGNWPIGEGMNYANGELNSPITMGGVTLTGVQGTAKNTVRYMTNTSKGNFLQVFKGNALKLTAPEGKCIVKAEVTMQTGSFDLTPSAGSIADNVWTGIAKEVTFTATATRYMYAINVFFKEVSELDVTVGEGYTAYSPIMNLNFTGTGIDVYTAKRTDGYVVLTKVESGLVPARAGVILSGTAGTVSVPVAAEAAALAGNEMVGVTELTAVDYAADGGKYNYILQGGEFRKATGAQLKAGRAYLSTDYDVTNAGDTRLLIASSEATGIKAIEQGEGQQAVYDLQGRQVQQPTKGLYIVNGKKVNVK